MREQAMEHKIDSIDTAQLSLEESIQEFLGIIILAKGN